MAIAQGPLGSRQSLLLILTLAERGVPHRGMRICILACILYAVFRGCIHT